MYRVLSKDESLEQKQKQLSDILNRPVYISSCEYGNNTMDHVYNETQRMAIVDKDPGSCIVCRGKSNDRRHIGSIVSEGSTYVSGLICKSCAPGVFEEWKKLLED